MNGSAAVTGFRSVIALGLGLSVIPRITHSAIDGFVVGAVLSASCCLLFVAPRRLLGRLRPAAHDNLPHPSAACAVTMPDVYIAAPVIAPPGDQAAAGLAVEYAGLYRERARPVDSAVVSGSRHGLAERVPLTWRSLLGPSAPRHAAPSPVVAALSTGLTVMAAKCTVRPLPVRN